MRIEGIDKAELQRRVPRARDTTISDWRAGRGFNWTDELFEVAEALNIPRSTLAAHATLRHYAAMNCPEFCARLKRLLYGAPSASEDPHHQVVVLCSDEPGILGGVAECLWRRGFNIRTVEQHADERALVLKLDVEFQRESGEAALGAEELRRALLSSAASNCGSAWDDVLVYDMRPREWRVKLPEAVSTATLGDELRRLARDQARWSNAAPNISSALEQRGRSVRPKIVETWLRGTLPMRRDDLVWVADVIRDAAVARSQREGEAMQDSTGVRESMDELLVAIATVAECRTEKRVSREQLRKHLWLQLQGRATTEAGRPRYNVLVGCSDKRGVTASVAGVLGRKGFNIQGLSHFVLDGRLTIALDVVWSGPKPFASALSPVDVEAQLDAVTQPLQLTGYVRSVVLGQSLPVGLFDAAGDAI